MDTKLTNISGTNKFNVSGKTHIYLHHRTPKLQNAINEIQSRVILIVQKECHQIKCHPLIKEKFMKTDYPLRFINSVINDFQKGKESGDESFIIATSLFEIAKPLIFVKIPYCELNEINSKLFLKKLHKFTNNSFRMVITWKTRNIRSLFPLKDKNDYKSCVIYKGDCSCGSRYIGETKRNAEVRWNEHNNPTKSSEPSKQLQSNINHYFTRAVISNAPKNAKTRKNLGASYIAFWKPDLNKQKDFERLVLFRNGVT